MNALETQTQIVGLGCPMSDKDRIDWLQSYADLVEQRLAAELSKSTDYLNVCLCDVTAEDVATFANWAFCKQHDNAVKLASMDGVNVLLHVRNERGEIVPVRGGA